MPISSLTNDLIHSIVLAPKDAKGLSIFLCKLIACFSISISICIPICFNFHLFPRFCSAFISLQCSIQCCYYDCYFLIILLTTIWVLSVFV